MAQLRPSSRLTPYSRRLGRGKAAARVWSTCLHSGRTAEGLANRDVQHAGWHAAEGQAVMLDRATQATALCGSRTVGLATPTAARRAPNPFAGERAFARRVRRVLDGWSVWADALKSLWKRAHFQTAPLVTAASAGLGTVRRLLALDPRQSWLGGDAAHHPRAPAAGVAAAAVAGRLPRLCGVRTLRQG